MGDGENLSEVQRKVAETIDLEFVTVEYLFRLTFRATLFTVGVSLWFLIRLWRDDPTPNENAGVCGLESGSGLTGRGAHKFEGILP
jgi:hypothetical protein